MSAPITSLLPVAAPRATAALAWEVVRRRRGVLLACAAMFVLDAAAGLVAPLALGRIVDVVRDGGGTDDLRGPVLLILVAAVVGMVATALAIGLLARAAEPALAELRERVLDRALHLEVAEIERVGAGDLLSRVGDDVRLVATSITRVVPIFTSSVLAIAFTSAGLFTLDWRLGLAGLLAVPSYWLGLRWYLPRSGPMYRREREANGERAEAFLTGVHASRTLRAFGLAEAHQRRVDAASLRSAQIQVDVYRMLTRYYGRNNRAELIGLLALLIAGYVLVRDDAVTVGAVTAAALLFHRLFNPVGAVMGLFDEVQSAGASLARLAGLALLPERPPAPSGRPGDGRVDVRGLRHEYVPGVAAVDGVDLVLTPGERVAVVGGSGAGKTTLAAAVAGRTVSAGDVLVGGRPVRGGAGVVLVTQEVHVFAGTVRDNLTLARPDASDDDLRAALDAVGATPWVRALPDDVDTRVGDAAHRLTPAQAQQLALARVLLVDPLVVVLDEATAEAGSAGSRELDQAAAAVTAGRTALVVAHRLSQAASSDRVVVMADGRIVEQGTHDELVAGDGAYARLWQAWSAG